jgi:hypothetical protein
MPYFSQNRRNGPGDLNPRPWLVSSSFEYYMFMVRDRMEFDDRRILPLPSNLLLEVVAYAIYSICVDFVVFH